MLDRQPLPHGRGAEQIQRSSCDSMGLLYASAHVTVGLVITAKACTTSRQP